MPERGEATALLQMLIEKGHIFFPHDGNAEVTFHLTKGETDRLREWAAARGIGIKEGESPN